MNQNPLIRTRDTIVIFNYGQNTLFQLYANQANSQFIRIRKLCEYVSVCVSVSVLLIVMGYPIHDLQPTIYRYRRSIVQLRCLHLGARVRARSLVIK